MSSLKGTQTEKNLRTALGGESEARNKYTFYASQAKSEGYQEFAEIISHIADNEKEHAKVWFKKLHGGKVPDLESCLEDCIHGENYEWTQMYPAFAEKAREEGFPDIALLFERVADIEKTHEAEFTRLLTQLRGRKVFESDVEACWVCLECGYVHYGRKAPVSCPVCGHDQSFFVRKKASEF